MVTSLEAGRDFLTRAIISSLMEGSGFWEGNFPKEPQLEILAIMCFSCVCWNVTLPDGAIKILRVLLSQSSFR